MTVTETGGVYLKSQTSIFTYRFIDQLIDISTEVKNGGRETSLGKQTVGHIEKTDIKDAPTGRTVAIIDRTKYQKY